MPYLRLAPVGHQERGHPCVRGRRDMERAGERVTFHAGVDVKVIVTPPCIIISDFPYRINWVVLKNERRLRRPGMSMPSAECTVMPSRL